MTFMNVLEAEKNLGIGYKDMNEYYASFNNRILMGETLKVKFSCNFAFRYFPFDKHECNLTFYDSLYNSKYVKLNKIYQLASMTENSFKTVQNKGSILFMMEKTPFNILVKINPASTIKDGLFSTAGIKLELSRYSIGLLLGSFYIPTGLFAILSMVSYVINPDAVCKN